jgi:ribosomal protein S18 acetylase RimI-like enzyme
MVTIREGREEDLDSILDLVLRLKRLNGEFDPLLKVRDDAAAKARDYLKQALGDRRRYLVLVAEDGGKVVGVLKADIRERIFYEPTMEGSIIDFYIMPEYRRRKLGEEMLNKASQILRERGAQLITAEFPSMNQIAVNFYTKRGFRPLTYVYAREAK